MSLQIARVETTIVDVPSRRTHRFANQQMDTQSYLVVAVTVDGGPTGVGEGVSPGGPWWGGESVEGQKAVIDHHLAPLLVGQEVQPVRRLMRQLDRVAFANDFAKAAVEMALHDAVGRALHQPVHVLLGGGAEVDRFPVRWALSAADVEEVVAEARTRLAEGHRSLKFKMGALPAGDDLRRLGRIIEALGTDASLLVDPNGTWDRRTAVRSLAELEAMGVDVLEQPIRREDLEGMADLVRRAVRVTVMADESVCTPSDALRAAASHACEAVAVKTGKAGGLERARDVAAICRQAGLGVYGGTALESSIGTAAALQLFAALPQVSVGTELVGPLLLADDLTVRPLRYADGDVLLPDGPGLGVEVDWDKVDKYTRRGL